MVLKGDSCLLNGRKPMFISDWTQELGVTDCIILRVSRLGKEVALKFADRYYDAIAPGADFIAMDTLREAQATQQPWTKALAFDYSLAIGEWGSPTLTLPLMGGKNGEKTGFNAFFCKNICVFEFFVVILHAFLKVLSTRISVLHRILVPRSEVRLLGGQLKGKPLPAPPHKGGHLVKRGTCDGIRAASRQLTTTAPY